MEQIIKDKIAQSLSVKEQLFLQTKQIEKAANEISSAYAVGKKILICGNGGSASDSQHFAAELVGRFKKERKALPAICLNTDTSILTSIGNDYGFDKIFSRQVEAIGAEGDILIGISTSGNSKNIIEAAKEAKAKKMKVICLLGNEGGALKDHCDTSMIIRSKNTPSIQESHIIIIHIICDMLESSL